MPSYVIIKTLEPVSAGVQMYLCESLLTVSTEKLQQRNLQINNLWNFIHFSLAVYTDGDYIKFTISILLGATPLNNQPGGKNFKIRKEIIFFSFDTRSSAKHVSSLSHFFIYRMKN